MRTGERNRLHQPRGDFSSYLVPLLSLDARLTSYLVGRSMLANEKDGDRNRTLAGRQCQPHRHTSTPRLVAEVLMCSIELPASHGPMACRTIVSLVERLHTE